MFKGPAEVKSASAELRSFTRYICSKALYQQISNNQSNQCKCGIEL
jgi:hypothetical protein